MIIAIDIPGAPMPWPRPVPVVERYGRDVYARMVADKNMQPKYDEFKRKVAAIVRDQVTGYLTTPVGLFIDSIFERGKSIKGTTRCPMRDVPDLDNLAKAILDSLVGKKTGETERVLLRDDRQCVFCCHGKWYGAPNEEAHTSVKICTTMADVVHHLKETAEEMAKWEIST